MMLERIQQPVEIKTQLAAVLWMPTGINGVAVKETCSYAVK